MWVEQNVQQKSGFFVCRCVDLTSMDAPNNSVGYREFRVTDTTLEAVETAIDAARKGYRRDYNTTTLDKYGWCDVVVEDGSITFRYEYIPPTETPGEE